MHSLQGQDREASEEARIRWLEVIALQKYFDKVKLFGEAAAKWIIELEKHLGQTEES